MVLRSTWSVSVSKVLIQPQDEWLLTGMAGLPWARVMVSATRYHGLCMASMRSTLAAANHSALRCRGRAL